MIGKVKVTSSGYDPDGPPVRDPTLETHPSLRDLEESFFAYWQHKVDSGETSRLDRQEETAARIALAFVSEHYSVTRK